MGKAGKILVVGGLPKNWEDFLHEPRVVLWVDGKADEHYKIPEGVVQVVASRFVSHATWQRVVNMAKKQGVTYSIDLKGPGEIKTILEGFRTPKKVERAFITPSEMLARLNVELQQTKPEVISAEKEVVVTDKQKPKSLAEFMRNEAKLDAEDRPKEIERLKVIAGAYGFDSKRVQSSFYAVRAKKFGRLMSRPRKSTRVVEATAPSTTPAHKPCKVPECVKFLKANAEMLGVAMLEIVQLVENLQVENARLKAELAPVAGKLKRLARLEDLIRKVSK